MQEAVIEHAIAGRMRLRLRAQRGDRAFFARLSAAIGGDPAVQRVLTNPTTGSILVFHSGNPEEIAKRAGVPALPRPGGKNGEAHRVRVLSGRALPSLQTLSLTGLALYQLARGRLAGSASEQLWYADRARALPNPPLAVGLLGLAVMQAFRGRWLAPASSFFMYALMTEMSRSRPAVWRRRLGSSLAGRHRHRSVRISLSLSLCRTTESWARMVELLSWSRATMAKADSPFARRHATESKK